MLKSKKIIKFVELVEIGSFLSTKLSNCKEMANFFSAKSSVKWTALGHPRPERNKIIFSPKPSGTL